MSLGYITGRKNLNYLATFINPVDHRLYDIVEGGSSGTVYVLAPMPNEAYKSDTYGGRIYGRGAFDESNIFEHDSDCFYRSHTPSGVDKTGVGLGLMLYSGISLSVARQSNCDGIFSEITERSPKASKWWEAQVERDFAEEVDASREAEEEVSVSIEPDMVDTCELEEGCEAEILSVYPESVTVLVDYSQDRQVQLLPAEKVAESGFVVAWDELEEEHTNYRYLMDDVEEVPSEVLVQADLSTTRDPSLLLNILEKLEGDPAISNEQLSKLVKSYPGPLKGIDSQLLREIVGQKTFPFAEVDKSAQKIEKQMVANPKRHSKVWKEYFGELTQPV